MDADRITTERLVLEPLGPDLARTLAGGDYSVVTAGAGWPTDATPIVTSRAARDPAATTWLITLDGTVIGECGLKHGIGPIGVVEIGYGLGKPWHGERYGTEAIRGLVGWLERSPASRVVAEVHETNLPSRRLLERLGFALDFVAPPYVWYQRDV